MRETVHERGGSTVLTTRFDPAPSQGPVLSYFKIFRYSGCRILIADQPSQVVGTKLRHIRRICQRRNFGYMVPRRL